jgi:hypothetical protein
MMVRLAAMIIRSSSMIGSYPMSSATYTGGGGYLTCTYRATTATVQTTKRLISCPRCSSTR